MMNFLTPSPLAKFSSFSGGRLLGKMYGSLIVSFFLSVLFGGSITCVNKDYHFLVLFQEGKIRAKLEHVLIGYDDVIYAKSDPTGEGVNAVSCQVM